MAIRSPLQWSRSSQVVAGAGAIALAALTGILLRTVAEPPQPDPTPPPPSISTLPTGLRTVPEVSPEVRLRAEAEFERFLSELYEDAFPPRGPQTAESSPASVAGQFTERAAQAFAGTGGIFALGERERVLQGLVRFGGVVTMDGDRPSSALLDVTFVASGQLEPPGPDSAGLESPREDEPPRMIELRQTAELLLVPTPDGWRIAGFDARLQVDTGIPIMRRAPERQAAGSWWP